MRLRHETTTVSDTVLSCLEISQLESQLPEFDLGQAILRSGPLSMAPYRCINVCFIQYNETCMCSNPHRGLT